MAKGKKTLEKRINVLDKGYIELIDHMGDDNTVVASARVSHLGESKGTEKDSTLIKYLIDNKHTSPFEHVVFQFMIKCPLFVARQWMRHRTWSYNEVSRRYTSEDIDFYIPKTLRIQSETNKQVGEENEHFETKPMIKAIEKISNISYVLYDWMLHNHLAREQARMILPQNMYTSFYGTVDLHNLFHFLELRNHPHSQYEIRVYAEAIQKLIEPVVPISYMHWKNKNVN